jgi:hypothetical protein
MIAALGAPSKFDLDPYRWDSYVPAGFAGLGAATTLTPLQSPNGGPIYATNSNGTASGAQLYEDATGAIVDSSGNSIDPYTGDLYQDEATGSYTAGGSPFVLAPSPSPSSQASAGPQIPSGSVIRFQAAWTVTDPISAVASLMSASSVISALSSKLPSVGMSLKGTNSASNGPANYAIDVNILDSIGNNLVADALGVITQIVQGQLGSGVVWINSPSISIVSTPSTGGAPTSVPSTPGATSPSWFSNLFSGSSSQSSPQPKTGISTAEWALLGTAGVLLLIVLVKK